MDLSEFRHIVAVDFEFSAQDGERVSVICMIAKEIRTNQTWQLFSDELCLLKQAPFPIAGDALVVAYFASAEMNCFISLHWQMPAHILDLYAEFRCVTNGVPVEIGGASLLGALAWFGLSSIGAAEKSGMRSLALRGWPYTDDEKRVLLQYCESDVDSLIRLLPKMAAELDLPRALLRGRYMKAVAKMETNGIPIDVDTLNRLKDRWSAIQKKLINSVSNDFPVFDGLQFKSDQFAAYLVRNNISWPRLPSGALALSDSVFRDMVTIHPQLAPIRDVRLIRSRLRQIKLAVGSDGRNRCLLSPFRSKTSRNQPSNSKFIYGPSVWLRGLIKPRLGFGVAYIDWSQQEFGIAAALSGDQNMLDAYNSGDPYLAFGKQCGAIAESATIDTHEAERNQFKACVLAVQYGMGPDSLAIRLEQPSARARELLQLHRETYSVFWRWSDAALDYAMLNGSLHTTFGWLIRVVDGANPRSLRNFPMQANGAEMLRLACCFSTERGVRVCAPVHDAILIEAPIEEMQTAIETARESMNEASRLVLNGFVLNTDVETFVYPDRYMDKRGKKMWDLVWSMIEVDAD